MCEICGELCPDDPEWEDDDWDDDEEQDNEDDWGEEEEYDPYPDIDILTDIARDRALFEQEGLTW